MEQSTLKRDFQSSTELLGIPLIPEEKQQTSFVYQISPREMQTTNGESQLEFQFESVPVFEEVPLADLTVQEFQFLDRARQVGWWIPTTAEFRDQLTAGVYNVCRMVLLKGHAILLTSFEIFPNGDRWLSLNYFCGVGCRKHVKDIRKAFWRLARDLQCTNVVFHAKSKALAKKLGGKELSILYELEGA